MQTLSIEVEAVSEKYFREEGVDDPELSKKVEKAEGILQALLQFCQRNSGRMDEKARQVQICTRSIVHVIVPLYSNIMLVYKSASLSLL